MDHYSQWRKGNNKRFNQTIEKLQTARNKLSPIIDDIMIDLIRKENPKFINKCSLTEDQYHDIVWAWKILKESESTYQISNNSYILPNSNVIVQNVSVQNKIDKCIVIDEATVMELLNLYEQMGVVIRKIVDEGDVIKTKSTEKSLTGILSIHKSSSFSTEKHVKTPIDTEKEKGSSISLEKKSLEEDPDLNGSIKGSPERSMSFKRSPERSMSIKESPDRSGSINGSPERSMSIKESPDRSGSINGSPERSMLIKETPVKSSSSIQESSERSISTEEKSTKSSSIKESSEKNISVKEDKDLTPPQKKSTLSALLSSSSSNLRKSQSKNLTVGTERFPAECEPAVFIRIQCFGDISEAEYDKTIPVTPPIECIECNKQCPSRYHVRMGGDPITLKVDQDSVEDGAVYCINTGSNGGENDIKIIIKQCPGCLSTVIGSSTKIKELLSDFGESHESITLHGKAGDESKMAYSSDESESFREYVDLCQCHKDGKVCKDKCDEYTSCICNKDETAQILGSPKVLSKSGIFSDQRIKSGSKQKMISEEMLAGEQRIRSASEQKIISEEDIDNEQMRAISDEKIGSASDQRLIRSPVSTPPLSPIVSSHPVMDVIIDRDNVDQSAIEIHKQQSAEEEPALPSTFSSARSSAERLQSQSSISKPESTQSVTPITRRQICSSMEFDVSTVPTRLRDREIEHGNAHIVVELKKLGVDQLLRACRPAKCCRQAILNERQKTALPYCVSLRSLPLMGNDVDVIKQSIDMSVKKIKNALDLTQAHKDKLAFYVSLGRDDFKPNINFPWVIPVYDVRLHKVKTNQEKFFMLKKTFGRSDEDSLNRIRSDRCFILKRPKKEVLEQKKVRFQEESNVKFTSRCYITNKRPRGILKRKNIWSSVNYDHEKFCFSNKRLKLDSEMTHVAASKSNFRTYKHSYRSKIEYFKKRNIKNRMDGGDCSASFMQRLLDIYFKNVNTVKENKTVSCWGHMSEELLYKSTTLTLHVNRKPDRKKSFFLLDATHEGPNDKRQAVKKNLEYYVGLLDGNLVWCNTLPLLPQNYEAYCNYSSEENGPPNARVPIEDPMVATRAPAGLTKPKKSTLNKDEELSNRRSTTTEVPPEDVVRFVKQNQIAQKDQVEPMVTTRASAGLTKPKKSTKNKNEEPSTRRSTISEVPAEDIVRFVKQNQIAEKDQVELPKQALKDHIDPKTFREESVESEVGPSALPLSMEPESENESWAPLLVSDTSLPRVCEESIEKKIKMVESAIPKGGCKKSLCVQNDCTDCKATPCAPTEEQQEQKPLPSVTIDITQTKDNGAIIQSKTSNVCNKEVCEIYKNKLFTPGKTSQTKVPHYEKRCILSGKKNIEIYIGNQKIMFDNTKRMVADRKKGHKPAKGAE